MKSETKNCQNCQKEFTIESEDFNFYEKIKVPPPTWCPECRLVRRFLWRNERYLYKDICKLCGKNIISAYDPTGHFTVYCPDCWRGDGWDALAYGQEYDFSRPFFEQIKELLSRVPRPALHQTNVVNSPYANYSQDVRNVYLSYSVIYDCENIFYSKLVDHSKQIFDSFDLSYAEICYENISGEKNYNTQFAYYCRSAIDSMFIYDCWNVSNCFLSVNLRNQKYCYKNKKYSKEEYQQIVDNYDLGSPAGLARAKKEFQELYGQALHRFAHTSNAVNSSGENLRDCKNVKNSFYTTDSENSKYLFRSFRVKDSMDGSQLSESEQVYEYMSGGSQGSQLIKFCTDLKPGNHNVEYSDYCGAAQDIFGCVGIRNKQYVILNKQYSKEEYEEIVPRIKKHMNEMPYIDQRGIAYKYGEFFPPDIAPFAYNETVAQEHLPKNKKEVEASNFRFKERYKQSSPGMDPSTVVKNIQEIGEEICTEVIRCPNAGQDTTLCTSGFRILSEELVFHKKINMPLPQYCHNCRYFERIKFVNPLKLWPRQCMCDKENHFHGVGKCKVEFETPYAPERTELVYCEQCYNKEVY